ncbi:kell blood group glycoprotein [Kryptolebias marmoratus]|uniref:Kell metallo-endopeptidase (Kell blood group) n=1 Tax=Kryptolebias marmoratus TaxID=37003 RepID=A0A3Q3ADR8_KRYMA|nr:kell blood group glycoprotein [Kryptolebias marmoratus]
MRQTSIEPEPELSLQSLSQSEPEGGPEPPPPAQDPHQLQQQNQVQPALHLEQLSTLEHQEKPPWEKHKRVLLFLLGLTIWAAILGLIFYIHHSLHRNSAPTVSPCLSPACRWAEAHLFTSPDPFTQPCDHLLSTCGGDRLSQNSGGRQRGHGIPGHPQNRMEKSAWPETQNEEMINRRLVGDRTLSRKTVLLQYLREILETNYSSNSSATQKTRDFYHSCLDTRSIETTGAEPFLKLIQKLGGWAVSGQWNKTDFNTTLGLLMRDYNTFSFFNLYVGKDPNETSDGTTKRYIQIDQPELLIPIEWSNETKKSRAKTEVLRSFFATYRSYLALLESPPNENMRHAGMFLSLSSELAVTVSPLDYRQTKGQLHQRMTIKELQRQAPAINWLGCLQTAFHPLSLSEDDPVLLHNLPYIVQMSQIITKWLRKQEAKISDPLHTFMIFNLLHTMMPAMDSRFSETAKNFSLALGHAEEEVPRWKQCVLETEKGFDSVLAHVLSERTAHREVEEVIENIFFAFKSKLNGIEWSDQSSSGHLVKKVHALMPKLSSSKKISDKDELDRVFSQVTVSTDSFFSNYLQLLSLWQKRRNKLLTVPIEAADVLSVTPVLLDEELLFPMGMFIPPFFHPTYPKAMNYGAVGFLMAKDIFHLLVPETYSRSTAVDAVGECVWAHYVSAAEKAGRGGALLLSVAQQHEVWVQYSALQVALQAYYRSLRQRPDDTSLLGIYHTHLFLRSFSQINCDADPYSESMPLDPSFFIAIICANPELCPPNLQCSIKPQQKSFKHADGCP